MKGYVGMCGYVNMWVCGYVGMYVLDKAFMH